MCVCVCVCVLIVIYSYVKHYIHCTSYAWVIVVYYLFKGSKKNLSATYCMYETIPRVVIPGETLGIDSNIMVCACQLG